MQILAEAEGERAVQLACHGVCSRALEAAFPFCSSEQLCECFQQLVTERDLPLVAGNTFGSRVLEALMTTVQVRHSLPD